MTSIDKTLKAMLRDSKTENFEVNNASEFVDTRNAIGDLFAVDDVPSAMAWLDVSCKLWFANKDKPFCAVEDHSETYRNFVVSAEHLKVLCESDEEPVLKEQLNALYQKWQPFFELCKSRVTEYHNTRSSLLRPLTERLSAMFGWIRGSSSVAVEAPVAEHQDAVMDTS